MLGRRGCCLVRRVGAVAEGSGDYHAGHDHRVRVPPKERHDGGCKCGMMGALGKKRSDGDKKLTSGLNRR
jgi:hypothetical protein